MLIRAVLFDLGNTLVSYYDRDGFPRVLRRCLEQALACTPGGSESVDDVFPKALELNRESADFAVTPLADRLRLLIPGFDAATGPQRERVSRAFMQPIFECARCDPAATTTLKALRRRGIRTAIVSNTPWGSPSAYWREELDRHGLLRLVDSVVFCMDVGWRKPHEAPMRRALEALGVPAAEACFVGDDPQWDVEGARRIGMRPVLLGATPGPVTIDCDRLERLDSIIDLVDASNPPPNPDYS